MRFGEFYRPGSEFSVYLERGTYLDVVAKVTRGEILNDLAATVYPAVAAGADGELSTALAAWQARWRLPDPWAREAAVSTARTARGLYGVWQRFACGPGRYGPGDPTEPMRVREMIEVVWPGLTGFDDWSHEIGVSNAWHPGLGWGLEEHRLTDPLGAEIGEVYGTLDLTVVDEEGTPLFAVDFRERWLALAWTRAEAAARLSDEFRVAWWRHLHPEAGPHALPAQEELAAVSVPSWIHRQFEGALRDYLDGVEGRALAAGWKRTTEKRAAGGGRKGKSEGREERRTPGPERHYRWLAEWQTLGYSDEKIASLERLHDPRDKGRQTVYRARTTLARRIGLTPRTKNSENV